MSCLSHSVARQQSSAYEDKTDTVVQPDLLAVCRQADIFLGPEILALTGTTTIEALPGLTIRWESIVRVLDPVLEN